MTPGLPETAEPRPTEGQAAKDELRPAASTRPSLHILRWLALAVVLGISGLIIVYGDRLARLGAYGYPGMFLLNLLSSATLILPAPGLALAFAAGGHLAPPLVGLAVGSGSALGELTGYVAGYSGRGVIENQGRYRQIQGWMRDSGLWVIFFLSLVPNPLFDIAGITAGAMRIPLPKFLAAAWAGKVLKSMLVAYAGAGAIDVLGPVLRHWLMR